MSYWHRIEIKDKIEASHQLFLPYESKCNNVHGHSYRFKIAIGSTELDANGMIVDFSKVKAIIQKYDHKHLNDVFMERSKLLQDMVTPVASTAENFALLLYIDIAAMLSKENPVAKLLEVAVSETRKTWAKVNWRATEK